jgi:hypothetical protein
LGLLLFGAALVAQARPIPVLAQSTGSALERLAGEWSGAGDLMGRAARFEMCWEKVLGGAFTRLRFANYFVTPAGDQRVIEAIGLYPARGEAGTWADSRGVVFTLRVENGPSTLTVEWTGTGESGRTRYELTADTTISVTDEVRAGGEYRPFATARLRRESPSCATADR